MNINIAMWGKALKVIPRVSREEWKKLDPIAQWLIATRGALFITTASAATIGGLFAVRAGEFHWWPFLLCFFGLIFAHATNNLINDFTDYKRGLDTDNYFRTVYGPQPLQQKLWSQNHHLVEVGVTALLALACAFGILSYTDFDTRVLGLIGVGTLFVLFYTWPLKYMGLGEIAEIAIWGPLMAGGTYMVLTNEWSWQVAAVSLMYGMSVASILFGKHTDKLKEDRAKKVYTLPVILGEKLARYTTIALIWLIPVLSIVFTVLGFVGWPIMLVLLAIPNIWRTTKILAKPRPNAAPDWYPKGIWPLYLSAFAFKTSKTTGSLLLLGLILDTIITRVF